MVAASGNFGDGTPQAMFFASGNDPFVITVGAADTRDTISTADDDVAAWSVYGSTADGFAKARGRGSGPLVTYPDRGNLRPPTGRPSNG